MLNCTLRYIILYVSDFDQAYTFYKDVLQLSAKMQQGTYVEFDTGQTTFAINTRDSVREEIGLTVPQEQEKTATFEVAFTVEDVAQTIDILRAKGVQIIKHTNISSTNQGHGLCYYFFIVEVKKSRPGSGIILESVFKTG